MAILKAKEIRLMRKEELEEKLKDLQLELLKIEAQKTKGKIKEIKKAIAKILSRL